MDRRNALRWLAGGPGLLLAGTLASPASCRAPESSPEARDRRNRARAAAVARPRQVTHLQRPVDGLNIQLTDGQSLADGQETWPTLTAQGRPGTLMLGESVWYANRAPEDRPGRFVPFGAPRLAPMRGVTLDGGHRRALSAAEVAALPPGDGAFGEPPTLGFANGLRALLDRDRRTDGTALVALNTAYSGQNIERLLPGGGFGYFERSVDAVRQVAALRDGRECVVLATLFVQGEFNYYDPDGRGVDTTQAGYARRLHAYLDAKRAALTAETGQASPFATFICQTNGPYTRDLDAAGQAGLAIGQAQLEVTRARDDAFLVGPLYPVTDKMGHLDSNGSRWLGNQAAKVAYRVLVERRRWEPLHPLAVTGTGAEVLIDFHVPEPPLVFDAPWIGSAATPIKDQGFRVTDGAGEVPIAAVTIMGATVVRLALARPMKGAAHVWFAHQATGGNGALRDSDAFVLPDTYEYRAGTGMYADADQPGLSGRPYPAWNWCVAFYAPVSSA